MVDFQDVFKTFKPYDPKNYDLFYSSAFKEKPADKCCIGHFRGDFGSDGKHFWNNFFDHHPELKTDEFKAEFNVIVDGFRNGHILQDRPTMRKIISQYKDTHPESAREYTHLFEFQSPDYSYFLRCFTEKGDYNFYIYCYNRKMLEQLEGEESIT